MKPQNPQQVRELLVREGWNASVIFYEYSRKCRDIGADLIRRSLPLLRKEAQFGQELRVLVGVIDADQPDEVVEGCWTSSIDALRSLYRTSPIGTEREREVLLGIARNPMVVKAMIGAVQSEPDADPSWLAVLSAEGSPAALAIVERSRVGMTEKHPRLASALLGFRNALQNPVSSGSTQSRNATSLPVDLHGRRITVERFWAIIELAAGSTDRGNTLSKLLSELTASQVAAFAAHFDAAMNRAYTYDLWAAAFVLLEGCSDDAFMDFRADLILRGVQVFDRLLEEPDALAEYQDIVGDETLVALAKEVYQEMTGKDLPDRATPCSEPQGVPIDFNDNQAMRKRYPRLSALSAKQS